MRNVIEFLSGGGDDLLGMRFTGKLTGSDYRDVVIPQVESLLEHFATLRVLVLFDAAFTGWTLSAAWANTFFDVSHRRDFDKVAMVGAPKWEEWCVRLPAALLMRGELRTYPADRLDDAWDWLRS